MALTVELESGKHGIRVEKEGWNTGEFVINVTASEN